MAKAGDIGTVSAGTLLPGDLIPAFMFELERLDGAAAAALTAQYVAEGWPTDANGLQFGDFITDNVEIADALMVDLFDALDNCAADGVQFGSLEGDGADFGFWPIDEGGF